MASPGDILQAITRPPLLVDWPAPGLEDTRLLAQWLPSRKKRQM
jgi:hypothetical protein